MNMNDDAGIFIFKGYYESMTQFKFIKDKWVLFDAIYNYGVNGIMPNLSDKIMPTFMVIKAFIDAKENKKSKKSNNGGADETQNKATSSGNSKVSASNTKSVKKPSSIASQKNLPIINKNNKNENKNKNENENKNKNKKSSSTINSVDDVDDEVGVDENIGSFVQPSFEDVKKFARESKLELSVEAFYNYYNSNGWLVKGKPMRDWKACAIKWNDIAVANRRRVELEATLGLSRQYDHASVASAGKSGNNARSGVKTKSVVVPQERNYSDFDFDSLYANLDDIEI